MPKPVLEEFPFSKYLITVFHFEDWSHREADRFVAVFFRKIKLSYVSSFAGVPLCSNASEQLRLPCAPAILLVVLLSRALWNASSLQRHKLF